TDTLVLITDTEHILAARGSYRASYMIGERIGSFLTNLIGSPVPDRYVPLASEEGAHFELHFKLGEPMKLLSVYSHKIFTHQLDVAGTISIIQTEPGYPITEAMRGQVQLAAKMLGKAISE